MSLSLLVLPKLWRWVSIMCWVLAVLAAAERQAVRGSRNCTSRAGVDASFLEG